MLLEILVALLIGTIIGTFTGIFPGIHINLIISFFITSLTILSNQFSQITLVVFIISMSITHTFLDFLPAIFLGAPEEDSFLSILPGHKLLQKGLGYQAVILTLYGSLSAIIIFLIIFPVIYFLSPLIYIKLKTFIPFILIFFASYSILRENKILLPLIIFLLSGILGFLNLNLPVKEPLLPLLTGLFGLSTLSFSYKSKTIIPKQKITPLKKIKLPNIKKALLASSITAPLFSFLPGTGSAHAAFISSEITEQNTKKFLFSLGMINTLVMASSFITIFTINKARTGSAAAIKSIMPSLSTSSLITILIAIIITSIIAFFITIIITKKIILIYNKLNQKILNISIIFLILILNMFLTNILGLIVLLTATFLGIFCISSSTKRIHLLGSLIIPVIIYYLSN